jgi:hypothetical protein
MKLSGLVALGAASLSVAQPHNHVHRHHARHGSPVEVRNAAVTETVAGPVVTIYELNGEDLEWHEVENGLKNGKYVLVDDGKEKISTVLPKPTTTPSPKPSPTPSPTPEKPAAKFFEKPTTTAQPTTTSVAPPPPPPSSKAPKPSAAPAPPKSDTSSPSGGGGIDSDFPSGKIKCAEFPSDYGAIYLDWLKHDGWSGIQRVPDFSFGIDSAIHYIETAIKSEGCTEKSFCSYACPAGYQKTQWPEAQGGTKESIGGLYCNADGLLELTRADVTKKLCEKGVGGVKVKSKLRQNAAICRTDYPGTESETIPVNTQPGGEYELCNPDQTKYYQWAGAPTSAQYYINNAGVPLNEACDWGVPGSNKGNWAPVNLGVGRASDGVTYISLFPNAPTNPDGKLNFNIEIKGDITGDCSYKNGNYYSGGSVASTGCTVGVPSGGEAYFEFY